MLAELFPVRRERRHGKEAHMIPKIGKIGQAAVIGIIRHAVAHLFLRFWRGLPDDAAEGAQMGPSRLWRAGYVGGDVARHD